jgi:putative oxidoreductase
MGFPLVLAWLVALGELAAGVLLLLGGFLKDWMTRLGALLVIAIMIGAIALVHWKNGWSGEGGMEFQVVMLLVALYLLIKGNRVNAPLA